ncbi:hypothetical protein ACRALDRAFT_211048 [Sodiomyces alcalophilus JCM 7366]|uniref:uncharacterized protein n=1 Tax=Sodiomyces alcalophilus JCM 7366 TaxID=591952 RepID=UPI0039B551EF
MWLVAWEEATKTMKLNTYLRLGAGWKRLRENMARDLVKTLGISTVIEYLVSNLCSREWRWYKNQVLSVYSQGDAYGLLREEYQLRSEVGVKPAAVRSGDNFK